MKIRYTRGKKNQREFQEEMTKNAECFSEMLESKVRQRTIRNKIVQKAGL